MNLFFSALLITLFLCSCAAQKAPKQLQSGFLSQKYYDKLAKIETPTDKIAFRWISPEFKSADYHHVIIDPVVAFPKPQATEQVSLETILTLQAKLTRLIEDAVQKVRPLAQSPGPGVMRVQTAVAAINISDKALAFYEYIPVALVAASASKATGIRDQQVQLYVEMRAVDSDTNEVLGVAIREITGENLENVKEKLEAQDLNRGMYEVGTDMALELRKIFEK